MTGDQWFSLLKLTLILAFSTLVLYGVYRLMKGDE